MVHLWGMALSRSKNNNRLPASQATTTFTTVVGMTLTLVLIGLLSVLSFLGSRWEKQLRQEVRIQVYFLRDLDTESLHTSLSIVETEESVAEARYIDPATASKKLELDLGESFVEFLGYVPLTLSSYRCIILTINFWKETRFQFLSLFYPKTFVSPI